jgi:hypothetical protein
MPKKHNISDYQEGRGLCFSFKMDQKLLYKAVKSWLEVAQKADYLDREYNPA